MVVEELFRLERIEVEYFSVYGVREGTEHQNRG